MNNTEPAPICFRCGYDLTGLELPRACPECGTLNDPQADSAAARAWFADIRRVLKGIVRPSTIPPGALYLLTDAESARIARRRLFRWLWLPAMLTTLLVAVGRNVNVSYEYTWQNNDGLIPKSIPTQKRTDSLFGSPSSFFAWVEFSASGEGTPHKSWSVAQPGWINLDLLPEMAEGRLVARNRRYALALKTNVDGFVFYFAIAHWFLLLFGFLPARKFLIREAGRSLARRNYSPIVFSIRNLSVLAAAPCGILLWMWFALGLIIVVCQLCVVMNVNVVLRSAPEFLLLGWPIAVAAGSLFVVMRDRARLAFPIGKWTAVVTAIVSSVGYLAYFFVIRLVY